MSTARRFAPAIVGITLLAIWETVTRAGLIPAYFLPAPTAVLRELITTLPTALPYATRTVAEALGGIALGAAVAIPLGYLAGTSATAARVIQPYAAASQAIPAIAMAPLLVLWLGYNFVPIAVLAAIMVFFPILLNTSFGLTHVDPDVQDAARLDGAGRAALLRYIQFPLALPAVLTGLRNGVTLAMTGAVVGEFTMGGQGLGVLLTTQRDSNDVTGMFATLVILAGIALILHGAVWRLEKYVKGQL